MNQDIIIYAFRYALGRETYAVGLVTDYLIENWSKIDSFVKLRIKSEIQDALKKDKVGMEMDEKCWKKILELDNSPQSLEMSSITSSEQEKSKQQGEIPSVDTNSPQRKSSEEVANLTVERANLSSKGENSLDISKSEDMCECGHKREEHYSRSFKPLYEAGNCQYAVHDDEVIRPHCKCLKFKKVSKSDINCEENK